MLNKSITRLIGAFALFFSSHALAQIAFVANENIALPAWEPEFPLSYGSHNVSTLFTLDLSNACFDPIIDHVIPQYSLLAGPGGDEAISNGEPPALTYTPGSGGEKEFTIRCRGVATRGAYSDQVISLNVISSDTTIPSVPDISVAQNSADSDTAIDVTLDALCTDDTTPCSIIVRYNTCAAYDSMNPNGSTIHAGEFDASSTGLIVTIPSLIASTQYCVIARHRDGVAHPGNVSDFSAAEMVTTAADPGGDPDPDLLDPDDVYFYDDFESYTAEEKHSDFGPYNRVSFGHQTCDQTEIISSGGPGSGNAYRAFLQDTSVVANGGCGRAEIRPSTDNIGVYPTYLGSSIPAYEDLDFEDDHFIYMATQQATCTGTCNPDHIGYAYKFRLVAARSDGGYTHSFQNLRPTANHSPNPPYHNGTNPHFAIEMASGVIGTIVKRKPDLGWNEADGWNHSAAQSWTLLTPAQIGEADFVGEDLDVYVIFRPDSRTDAQGGDGYASIWIEQSGVCPSVGSPRMEWNGSTYYPGKFMFRSSDGSGPIHGNFSLGIYNPFWHNGEGATGMSAEHRYDNLLVFDSGGDTVSQMLTKACNTLALTDFSGFTSSMFEWVNPVEAANDDYRELAA